MGFKITTHVGYDNISSKFSLQVAGLKVKVTVPIKKKAKKKKKKKKKKICHRSSAYIYQWI